MKIEFSGQKMLLSNVNVRAELHGEDREPAGDIKFEMDAGNDILAEFHPALKSLLYHWDEGIEHDLADQGKQATGHAPDIRMPKLVVPLKWEDEMAGAKITITATGKAQIVLDPVKVNNFAIEPLQGGTVSLSFRVQCHPDEKSFGKLATIVQQEVEVTLVGAP